MTDGRGGLRAGAGRKVGYRKPEGVRKNRTLKAYNDEWEMIKAFAGIVKKEPEKAARMMTMEQ